MKRVSGGERRAHASGAVTTQPPGGNQRDEYLAYGLPWDDEIEARVAQMVEGLELTLALWQSREPVTFAGAHYHLEGAICNPPPAPISLWFGRLRPALRSTESEQEVNSENMGGR